MTKKKGNPDLREDLMLLAIEQLALSRSYMMAEKQILSASQFVEFLDSLQIESWELEDLYKNDNDLKFDSRDYYKKYTSYLHDLEAKYSVIVDYKKKIISGYNSYLDRQIRICKDYLRAQKASISSDSFARLFNTSQSHYDLLERLVVLKYYIKFGMQLRFEYQKIMGDKTRRIVIPLAITDYGNYICLVAIDLKDKITRSYILSCITDINSDLLHDFKSLGEKYQSRKKFDLAEFIENEDSSRFYREKIQYKLRISKNSLFHFKHTFNYDFKIIDDDTKNQDQKKDPFEFKTITFLATDRLEIERLLFDYDCYVEILEPVDIREAFAKRLATLARFYHDQKI